MKIFGMVYVRSIEVKSKKIELQWQTNAGTKAKDHGRGSDNTDGFDVLLRDEVSYGEPENNIQRHR